MEQKLFTARKITFLAVLVALVIVLQTLATALPPIGGVSITLTLVPIAIGGMILGPVYGGIIGCIFGIITFIYGLIGFDGFTFILISEHPVITLFTCLIKGTAAGVVPALVYKVMSKKHRYVGTFVAAGLTPIINTGIFILGALLMLDTLSANFLPEGQNVIYFLFMGIVLVNFAVELALNLVLSPAIYRVIELVKKNRLK